MPSGAEFRTVSAVMSGVAEVRAIVAEAQEQLALNGRRSVLFIDEIHRFNKAQQDALLPHVEDGTVTLIGATTENPYFEVNSALLSRMRVWRLEPLTDDDVSAIGRRALEDAERGLAGMFGPRGGVAMAKEPFDHLVEVAGGDARQALNILEAPSRSPRTRTPTTPTAGSPPPSTRSSRPRSSASSPTTVPATATTTRCPRSSRASAATTPTPRCTGWRR